MKTIRIDKQEGVKLVLYPDNQPHVIIQGIEHGDEVRVVAPIRSSLELMYLLEVSNALSHIGAIKYELVIPYLMGARSDRIMKPGDSFDLEIIASLVNFCNFNRVNLFDVHSSVAVQQIIGSKNHNNSKLVAVYDKPKSVLICPDAGAMNKVGKLLEWNKNLTDVVYCEKSRDLSNGKITLKVNNTELCYGRDCVIIDDLCDGGGTFIAIAEQIKPASLTLIISHGIFSKGFKELEKYFNNIITSDSYGVYEHNKILTTIPLGL